MGRISGRLKEFIVHRPDLLPLERIRNTTEQGPRSQIVSEISDASISGFGSWEPRSAKAARVAENGRPLGRAGLTRICALGRAPEWAVRGRAPSAFAPGELGRAAAPTG